MHALGTAFVDAIIGCFFVGLAGSAVVILISFVEDFKELFGPDEGPEPTSAAPQPHSALEKTETHRMSAIRTTN